MKIYAKEGICSGCLVEKKKVRRKSSSFLVSNRNCHYVKLLFYNRNKFKNLEVKKTHSA